MRAAFFGLGVFRYLAEAGTLSRVRVVSAVSGGSIAAAILAERWPALRRQGFTPAAFDSEVVTPFASVVQNKNLRNRGVARWAATRATPGGRFGSARGRTLVKHLLTARVMSELATDLQIVLTSTDLASGRAFRMSQEFVGGWDYGYSDAPAGRIELATALAASTAVPLLFPPVHLRTANPALANNTPRELSLVDGGVYDNLGLEWFQGWDRGRPEQARECDFVLAVDASGPLRNVPRRYGWARSVKRSQAAQYTQSRTSRIRWFVDRLLSGEIEGIYIPIDKDPASFRPPGAAGQSVGTSGPLPLGFAGALAELRTDLDRFSSEEVSLLLYHGYWAAHVRLHGLHPHLATGDPEWRTFATVDSANEARLLGLLERGAKRRFYW